MFFMLGCLLNAAHGNLRIAAINTLGSIGGALAVGFEARDHIRRGAYPLIFRVVGASGGIYSLTGAQLGNLIINWAEVPFRYAHVAVLTMMLLTDLLLYIFMHDSLISYASHGGGFITGVLVGPLLLINVKKRKWEKWVQMAFGVLSSAYFVAGIVNLLTLPEIRA